jgi:hypothetical protein
LSTTGDRSTDQVFINCPFDPTFAPMFQAIVFAVKFCGFTPRCARELDDEFRMDKLFRIMGECRYGIHDLSRTELDRQHGLPRFNMPFELGVFLGAKHFGDDEQRSKRTLILDIEPYRYQKFLSDLNGMDPHSHGNDPAMAASEVRTWLRNVSRRKLAGPVSTADAWRRFEADLPAIALAAGCDPTDLPYADYEAMVTDWLAVAR